MELQTLPSISKTPKRRLGQGHGSGRVKTSGRGTKGQKARNKVALRFEGGAVALTKRLPFQRGKEKNKAFYAKAFVINLDDLANVTGDVIDEASLIAQGIVPSHAKEYGVKLLGSGEVKKAYTVKIPASQSAIEKITKAGGRVEPEA